MSTTLPDPEASTRSGSESDDERVADDSTSGTQFPDASYLQDRTPDFLKFRPSAFGFTLFLGLVYVFLSYQPVWHTDIWGHLAYGRLIEHSGSIPETEPLMPLSSGMRFVDTAWLSQLLGWKTIQNFSIPGIQFLYAASITGCLAALICCWYRRMQSVWISLLGCVLFLYVEWSQIAIVRPQLAGLFCFTLLLSLLASRIKHKSIWFVVPALFLAWANLHGSFPVGIVLLGSFLTGRVVDLLWRSRNIASVWHDQETRRYFLLLQLAIIATCFNPYALGLYAEVLTFSSNPNLAALVEWGPLQIEMRQGKAAAFLALCLVILYRLSPRRISFTEVLLIIGLGVSALWSSRMIIWWGPVAAHYFVIQLHAIWNRRRNRNTATVEVERRGIWAVVSLGVIWISFGFSPFGSRLIHGPQPVSSRSLSFQTPVGAVTYLKKSPPQGQIFNTYEWGDYMLWQDPEKFQVFVASHAHLVPTEVWNDYLAVTEVASGWDLILDRYSVNTVVVDKMRRTPLIDRLSREDAWEYAYDDNVAAVFVRRQPL